MWVEHSDQEWGGQHDCRHIGDHVGCKQHNQREQNDASGGINIHRAEDAVPDSLWVAGGGDTSDDDEQAREEDKEWVVDSIHDGFGLILQKCSFPEDSPESTSHADHGEVEAE